MIFSSFPFFIFFGVYLFFHILTPAKFRIWLIIAGSTFFYGYWNPAYILLPYGLTLIGFIGSLLISSNDSQSKKKTYLWATLIFLLAPLIFFKYTLFFLNSIIAPVFPETAKIDTAFINNLALPLGISFITFTLISYVVDVYKGTYQTETKYHWLLGYILYFPQLIAGPILRPSELLSPLKEQKPRQKFLRRETLVGFIIFTIGLAKKTLFADQIAKFINPSFVADATLTFQEAVIAFYGFAMQIYCDFSGYTDMAIGAALILGIKLPQNFERPYGAQSITEFWHKWHITLSNWLRDYLYISLGGNRCSPLRRFANVMITMLLGGLWHGANWTFVLWGALHGLLVATSNLPAKLCAPYMTLPHVVRIFITFHIVAILWVIFRSPNLEIAMTVYEAILSLENISDIEAWSKFIFPIALMAIFYMLHIFDTHKNIEIIIDRCPKPIWIAATFMIWVIAIAFSVNSSAEFIYFDF